MGNGNSKVSDNKLKLLYNTFYFFDFVPHVPTCASLTISTTWCLKMAKYVLNTKFKIKSVLYQVFVVGNGTINRCYMQKKLILTTQIEHRSMDCILYYYADWKVKSYLSLILHRSQWSASKHICIIINNRSSSCPLVCRDEECYECHIKTLTLTIWLFKRNFTLFSCFWWRHRRNLWQTGSYVTKDT